LFCLVTVAQAQTIIVQPDGTVITCVVNGSVVQCW